ncbi:helix-turn-helix domain-containing protein [Aquamicrobium sp. LC103]|uniref:helix-turn-helix domain-containing protein n=1 Tax=Aquamicrobium sp. LC103 TaxID=1120658 RepID=UPI0014856BC2|nr:helix-turn-helix domain-containing protein [Aquamicrobium sp. LC103]
MRLIGGGDENLDCHAEAFHFGEVVLTYYRCAAQSFDRSRTRIGRDGLDHITFQICVSGRHGRRDRGTEDEAGPGDMLIADLAQRQATATSDFSSLNLTVPRRLLAPLLKAPDAQNLRRIPGETPLMVLLRNHLQGLHQAAPRMRRGEVATIVGPTLELAAAAVNAAVADENAAAVRMALTGEIRRHVEARIADPILSVESVAAAFAMSTRKLYYLFEPHGGFTHYVQAERLRRCRAELTDPAHRHESVAEIAGRYGFTHRKSFIRAFRRAFEMTPRETRALAAEGRSLTVWQADAARHMWHWIRELR